MILFPNAKINLGLHVIAKNADGYHTIESLIYPLPFYDVLEIIPSEKFRVVVHGETIPEGENLITKTWQILKDNFDIPPVEVHLLKTIPLEAGLGGGSSDSAHFMKALNRMFSLGLSTAAMKKIVSGVGSDCPFFIENLPALVSGRGDHISPVDISLFGRYIVLVLPDIRISTREAYANVKPRKNRRPIREIIGFPVEKWKEELVNDFEGYAFAKHPELKNIKNSLYNAGAVYASLSGSGSAVFGIFNSQAGIPELNYRTKTFTIGLKYL